MNDFEDILVNGISFSRGGTKPKQDDGKVKTKAKKKKYITGAHGSGSAKQKARTGSTSPRTATRSTRPPSSW